MTFIDRAELRYFTVGVFAAAAMSCKSRGYNDQSAVKEKVALGISGIPVECKQPERTGAKPGIAGDLAGEPNVASSEFHYATKYDDRAIRLTDCFFTLPLITQRVADLKVQLGQSVSRPWDTKEVYDWDKVSNDEIIADKRDKDFKSHFAAAIFAASEVEAPVNSRSPGYGGESFFYINPLFPSFAKFVAGNRDVDLVKRLTEKGVWESEEFGHSGHFKRIYTTLTGDKNKELTAKSVSELSFINDGGLLYRDPLDRIEQHLLTRVAAEVSASAVYFWLLSHSTGNLQRAILQPFEDELGHLAKFWAFYRWSFPDSTKTPRALESIKSIATTTAVTKILAHMFRSNSSERTGGDDLGKISLKYQAEIVASTLRVLGKMTEWDVKYANNKDFMSAVFDQGMGEESVALRLLPRQQLNKMIVQRSAAMITAINLQPEEKLRFPVQKPWTAAQITQYGTQVVE